jgi:hypothetical protein
VAKVLFKYRPATVLPGMTPPPGGEPPRHEAPEGDAEAVRKTDRWWYESSYDLRNGLEVNDEGDDTVPGDLFDELFKR